MVMRILLARIGVVECTSWSTPSASDLRNVGMREIKEHEMSSAKEAMIAIFGQQPEDSSYNDILRQLAFARMVHRGFDDSDAGRTLSDDHVKRKIESWQK